MNLAITLIYLLFDKKKNPEKSVEINKFHNDSILFILLLERKLF